MCKDALFSSILWAAHDSLENPVIYDLAVNNAIAQISPKK